MNELRCIGTSENDKPLFQFPSDGVLFYFQRKDWDTLTLHAIDTLEGAETDLDESASFEDLPSPVRAAITRSNYRMAEPVTTLRGAMANGD